MPLPSESRHIITLEHEAGKEPEVKTQIVKMMRAKFGGKITLSQKLVEGNGSGSLFVGRSRIHNPESQDVDVILADQVWTEQQEVLLDKEMVNYPFLVLSANFTDLEAAKVEVEVFLSWNPIRGR